MIAHELFALAIQKLKTEFIELILDSIYLFIILFNTVPLLKRALLIEVHDSLLFLFYKKAFAFFEACYVTNVVCKVNGLYFEIKVFPKTFLEEVCEVIIVIVTKSIKLVRDILY
jgi:hypothetical protein